MADRSPSEKRPIILITGAAGTVGTALVRALEKDWQVVGLDLDPDECACEAHHADLTDPESITSALQTVQKAHGRRIASVIHLAAYFDFTGEDHPLYEKLNVEGTRHLLRALQWLDVEQFLYAGTMLVHRPGRPGERIDETAPLGPRWAYPISKARAEQAICEDHGDIPYHVLRLAGLYDDRGGVPTLTHQIARIYERSPKSRFYSGDVAAGQAYLHVRDMVDAMRCAIERRADLPSGEAILVGEPETLSYREMQDAIGGLIHGEGRWRTMVIPAPYAKAAAWLESRGERIIPDDFDRGEKPFIRPFMIDMAEDHYELDITRARELLGWSPKHRLAKTLPKLIEALTEDPRGWYSENAIAPPHWLQNAAAAAEDAEALRAGHEARYRAEHHRNLWAHFLNIALGLWLAMAGVTLGYQSAALVWSDLVSGAAIAVFSALALSWRLWPARWVAAACGVWLLFAPLVFWAPTAAAYLNDTLVGALVIGFAVVLPPPPGVERTAAEAGPDVPPGWDASPSSFLQRAPIIALAVIGLLISRYMAAYQLGHIDGVWDPFFAGGPDPKNGTEEIVTSDVSEAWPVPDAGLGAVVYLLEILTGLMGSIRRWRTMPWLVLLFGFLIVPLGTVSITFIIIQPILIGTWCTLCLVGAAAMLLQIPYSFDEILATLQFLRRRRRAGAPMLRVLIKGDIDTPEETRDADDFDRPAGPLIARAAGGGVGLPWTLALTIAVGASLMLTRLTLGSTGSMADAEHLIGALVITLGVASMGESLRPLRLLMIPLAVALVAAAVLLGAGTAQTAASIAAALALVVLCLPRGHLRRHRGGLERRIV